MIATQKAEKIFLPQRNITKIKKLSLYSGAQQPVLEKENRFRGKKKIRLRGDHLDRSLSLSYSLQIAFSEPKNSVESQPKFVWIE